MEFLHLLGTLVGLVGITIFVFVFLFVGIGVESLVMVGVIHYGGLGSEFWALLYDFLLERCRFVVGSTTNINNSFLFRHAWLVIGILGLHLRGICRHA